MELNLQFFMMVAVGVIIGALALALKYLAKLEKTLEKISWSCSACADKLNFVERRMEHAFQSGDETARHLCQVVMEYNGELAVMSLKWALRQTLEVYSTWRAARM